MDVDDWWCDEKLAEQLREVGNELSQFPTNQVDELLSLLHKVGSLLEKVEQVPTELRRNAYSQCKEAFLAEPLLRHKDADVQVAVASCIAELLRITVPETPYNDDQLMEVFQLIVSSFANLSDMSSPTYDKRVYILEIFAKVNVGVVMLDLQCEGLISEMFQHFLSSIRECHPENVFSYMETIMTFILEESEDVPMEFLTPILASLKRNNEEISTSARKLGESVLAKCAVKLRPYLKMAVEALGVPLDGYSEIVATICGESNGEVEHNSGIVSVQKEKREAAELVSKSFRHDDEIVAIDKNDQGADESNMPATKRRRHLTTEDIQTEIDNSASGDNAPASGTQSQSQSQTTISKMTTKSKNVDEQSLKLEESTGSIAGAFRKIWSILGRFRSQ